MTNFTPEELLQFNEMMLGRGMPVQEDGIGYNKADYGACSTYYYGLSYAQMADLAKRLVKYCNTQLGVDKDTMKATAEALASIADPKDRNNGISVDIREEGTIISFRYNEDFIEIIKNQPRHLRKYDGDSKSWMVANERLITTLNELSEAGADVENALVYASNHELINTVRKVEVLTKDNGDYTLLKFNYNPTIVDEIKQTVDKKDREWNNDYKFWAIHKDAFVKLADKLADLVVFKAI